MTTKGLIAAGCRHYLGWGHIPKVEVHSDPNVYGTYAVRVSNDTETYMFLLVGFRKDVHQGPEWISENLEECEFKSWPPTAGGSRFM